MDQLKISLRVALSIPSNKLIGTLIQEKTGLSRRKFDVKNPTIALCLTNVAMILQRWLIHTHGVVHVPIITLRGRFQTSFSVIMTLTIGPRLPPLILCHVTECTHEKADTSLILHARHAALTGHSNIACDSIAMHTTMWLF